MLSFRSEIFWQRGSHDTAGFHLSRREEGTIVYEEKAKVILNLALCVGFSAKQWFQWNDLFKATQTAVFLATRIVEEICWLTSVYLAQTFFSRKMHCCSCFKCTALFCFSLVDNYFLWLQNSMKLSIIFLLPLSWNKFCFTTELDGMWVYLMSQPYFHCFESLLQSCSQPFDM